MGSVMSEENTATQEFVDNSPEAIADREEEAKIQAAQAELDAEEAEASGLILGKYESTEDLAAAYQNLQRELQRVKDGSADQGEPTPEPVAEAEPTAEPQADADSGDKIDPERLAALTQSVHEQAGGKEKFERLTAWAKDNCSTDQINAYNEALNTGDQYIILNALKGIQYDYMMSNGFEPKLARGRAPTQDVQAFRSRYEYQAAMNDPRYGKDTAFTKDVERRIYASPDELFGVN